MKEKILDYIINSEDIQGRLKNIQSEYRNDFIQDFYLIIMDYDEDKLIDIWNNGKIENFCSKLIKNNIKSKSSKFYTTYNKWDMNKKDFNFENLIDNKNKLDKLYLIEKIEEILDTRIYWYDAHLFRLYYLHIINEDDNELMEPKSLRDIQKYHNNNINYNSIRERIIETMIKILNILIDEKQISLSDLNPEWIGKLDKPIMKRYKR